MKDLRDDIAKGCLEALLNGGAVIQKNEMSGWGLVNTSPEDLAGFCYQLADAMMKARLAATTEKGREG